MELGEQRVPIRAQKMRFKWPYVEFASTSELHAY